VAGALVFGSFGVGANAYAPEPTPTATATPSPTPTPTPSPTPTVEPGRPPIPNGVTNPPNPPRAVRVTPQFTVLSRAEVVRVPARYFVFPAARDPRLAPRADRKVNGRFVPIYKVRQVVRLVATVPANQTFNLFLRRGGRLIPIGTATSTAGGQMSLPGFRVTEPGLYEIALTSTSTRRTYYLKVSIGAA